MSKMLISHIIVPKNMILLSRVFHKNLKIFKDQDFSENQDFDTVFHALSTGYKIRAVRNL